MCYDKVSVNVAAYVIPGQVYVWCGVNRFLFIITTHYYIVFYHFNNS